MEYRSNAYGVLLNLENRLKKASDVSALQREVAAYLYASNLRRIHNEGLDVNQRLIGVYSLKPIYINPANSPRKFATVGKTGKAKFKNGKPHRTGYFNGYLGFRAAIGRDVKVNLQLSGKLRLDWAMDQEGKRWVIGFRSLYGTQVSMGNEQHFGRQIWGVTRNDREQIVKIEKEFINKPLAKT